MLRHTALTRIAEGCNDDPFVVMKIAGHSSITITQRYIHPQAEAIGRVFASLATNGNGRKRSKKAQQRVGTKLGTVANPGKKPVQRAGKQKALKPA